MKTREKVELGLIPVAAAGAGLAARWLPVRPGLGELLAIACLIWLVQGGVRDLWLLYAQRTQPASAPPRRLACLCLESSVGLTGVVLGVGLALAGIGRTVPMGPLRWVLLTAAVLVVGFLAKDLVITWRPLGVRRDPDHHSIIFTWRA